MKKFKKNYNQSLFNSILVNIFILFCTIFTLTACTPKWVSAITEITDVIWYSQDPKIEILILKENTSNGFGYIYDDEEKIDVYFSWRFAYFDFHLATEYEISKPITTGAYPAISGQYRAISDTEAVLIVHDDYIFNGKYKNRSFTIKCKNIDRNTLDIKYYTNVCWNSTSPNLSFKISYTERRKGKGNLIDSETNHYNIIFFWEENSKFSIYELQDEIQSESPILTGTYVSGNMEATLTIEEDAIFNYEYETIRLVAKGINRT